MKVLVVEDDRKVAGFIEQGLREEGYAVDTAADGQQAVWLATERLGALSGRNVLVLGAGKMGEGMAVALAGSEVSEVVVINRTPGRGAELAARVGGRAAGLDELERILAD